MRAAAMPYIRTLVPSYAFAFDVHSAFGYPLGVPQSALELAFQLADLQSDDKWTFSSNVILPPITLLTG
jgi:hypothetical protein